MDGTEEDDEGGADGGGAADSAGAAGGGTAKSKAALRRLRKKERDIAFAKATAEALATGVPLPVRPASSAPAPKKAAPPSHGTAGAPCSSSTGKQLTTAQKRELHKVDFEDIPSDFPDVDALVQAAFDNNVPKIVVLLDKNVDINATDPVNNRSFACGCFVCECESRCSFV